MWSGRDGQPGDSQSDSAALTFAIGYRASISSGRFVPWRQAFAGQSPDPPRPFTMLRAGPGASVHRISARKSTIGRCQPARLCSREDQDRMKKIAFFVLSAGRLRGRRPRPGKPPGHQPERNSADRAVHGLIHRRSSALHHRLMADWSAIASCLRPPARLKPTTASPIRTRSPTTVTSFPTTI